MEGVGVVQLHRTDPFHRVCRHDSPRLVRDKVAKLLATEHPALRPDVRRWFRGYCGCVRLPLRHDSDPAPRLSGLHRVKIRDRLLAPGGAGVACHCCVFPHI